MSLLSYSFGIASIGAELREICPGERREVNLPRRVYFAELEFRLLHLDFWGKLKMIREFTSRFRLITIVYPF